MTDLRSLLHELGSARSPIQRMKLLTRAWKTLSHLTPPERKEIAARLGVRGFEEVLERFGVKKTDIVPEEVLDVLDKAGDLEASEVGRLIDDLRDPRRRRQLVSRGLGAVRDQLLGRHETAPAGADEDEPGEERAGEKVPADAVPEPVPAPAITPEPPTEKTMASPPRPETSAAPVPEIAPAPAAPDLPATAAGSPREAESSTPLPPGLARELSSGGSLLARFRILRGRLSSGAGLPEGDLHEVLAAFPPGWARRRALSALLSAGLPDDTADAIDLVEALETESSRRWCASVLLHSRDLSEANRRRLRELY